MTETPPTPPTSPTAPPLPPQTPLGPVAEPERIVALDVLRGVAIFGIFMVNMQFFAMPLVDLFAPPIGDEATRGDFVGWAVVKAFFEYKFISIFSLLFGMGMVVQMRRAEAKGRPFAPVYLRRLFVLMCVGLAHALLFWYGDILFVYSLIGFLVFVVMLFGPSARVLLMLAAVGVLVSVSIVGCFGALGAITGSKWQPGVAAHAEAAPEASGDETPVVEEEPPQDPWERVKVELKRITETGDLDAWREIEVIAYKEGPLLLALIVRAVTFGIILTFMTLGGFMFRILAMFLLGAALMKLDFFSPRHRRWHWFLCAAGLPLGAAGELLVLRLLSTAGETITWGVAMADPLHQISSLVLCLGYVGAITLLVNDGAVPVLGRFFGAVGRLALTNYLLQTLVSTLLMYWWGFAWFADVSRPRQIALVLIIYAGQVLASIVWLRFFSIGPFEWVWRSLTYLRPQPVRRRRPV
ncbi:MAG: DUF418 domain-containing protein [Planctomycetota bacterium]|jgi:uncharacterized protein